MLDREEYVEQSYFFKVVSERLPKNMPLQDLLLQVRDELLATTRLPLALDFMLAELRHGGACSPAMARLPHYFTPFQTYVMSEAENERGRFDMRLAVEILRREAEYRAAGATPQGLFLFQFEALCRNRLRYDPGLTAIARDSMFEQAWREWILTVRQHVGLVDFADLIYLRSQYAVERRARLQAARGDAARQPAGAPAASADGADGAAPTAGHPADVVLFGEKEGRIALANRRKDPLYLFAALQRHLGYPEVPRPSPQDTTPQLIPQLMRRVEQLETRIRLLEEDQREGFDLSRFYQPPPGGEGAR